MSGHNECFLEVGVVRDNNELTGRYIRQLNNFDEGAYEKHLSCKDTLGNTLLHVAVLAENMEALQKLVSLENVNLDVRNKLGLTPLLLCLIKNLKPALAKCLMQAGCDVNVKYGHWEPTPLIVIAQSYHDIATAQLLIKHGADINATNSYGNTALHTAVSADQYELACMLLYYGACADERNIFGETPFFLALASRNTDMEELLLDYVVDVNTRTSRNNLLMLAMENNSPFCSKLLDMGADIYYVADKKNCLALSLNLCRNEVFKRIWGKFSAEAVYKHMFYGVLFSLRYTNMPDKDWLECLYILLTSERVHYIIKDFYKQATLPLTVIKLICTFFSARTLPQETLYEYVCLVLTTGENVYFTDIETVYKLYGYGDTLKLLLLMDVIPNCCRNSPLPYLMCNFTENERDVLNGSEVKRMEMIEFNFDHRLPFNEMYSKTFPGVEQLWSKPPEVPKLIELARNATRKAIGAKCDRKTSCQFYTFLRRINLPDMVEKILLYVYPIY